MKFACPGSKCRVSQWKFVPNLWSSLATLLLLPLFVYLGFWQLQRMELKQNWENEQKIAAQAKAITLPELQQLALAANGLDLLHAPTEWVQSFRQRTLQLEGKFLAHKNILLDNQVLNGQAGYRVLTVFQPTAATALILVDRGFIPWGKDRSQLPFLPEVSEILSIQGRLIQLSHGLVLKFDAEPLEAAWPLQIQTLDYKQLSERLKQKLYPFLIQLPEGAPHSFQHLPVSFGLSSVRHLGYAIQWFTMALAIFVYYWVAHIKRR